MAEINLQSSWSKRTYFANEFARSERPFYLPLSVLAAAADRLTALAAPTTYATTKVIPANTLAVGDIIELRATVNFVAVNGTDTQVTSLLQAANILAITAATTLTAGTTKVTLSARGIVNAIGYSGEIAWLGHSATTVSTTYATNSVAALHASVDTTAALTFYVGCTQSANSASNQSDLRQFDLQLIRGVGSGIDAATVSGNVNSLGIPGVKINTAGERVRRLVSISDINTLIPFYVRVLWSSGSSDTADTITWKVAVKVQTAGAALSGTVSDTVSLADTVSGLYHYQTTLADKFAAGTVDNGETFMVEVEMDAKAAGLTEDIYFLGVELLYLPVIISDIGLSVPALPTGWPGT